MLIDCDVTGAVIGLVGRPGRTGRVARKYARAGAVIECSQVDQLEALAEHSPALVIICAGADDDYARWRAEVSRALPGVLLSRDAEEPRQGAGKVFLIGAGPGHPGYLTVRAREALAESDVVLIDHLAPTADIQEWAPAAEIIDVGKVPGKHKVPQRQIDQLMIDAALAGRNVARLKGGDPYVFGRGSEELYVCEQAGLDVEVISGVTASIAVPARADVPMTLRKVSHLFSVVSGHAELSNQELNHLAELLKMGGTVSLLMGVRTLPHTVAGLLERGVDSDLPIASFENVYRPGEKILFSTLGNARTQLAEIKPPAITVIGRVVDAGCAPESEAQARRQALLELALSEGRDLGQ